MLMAFIVIDNKGWSTGIKEMNRYVFQIIVFIKLIKCILSV